MHLIQKMYSSKDLLFECAVVHVNLCTVLLVNSRMQNLQSTKCILSAQHHLHVHVVVHVHTCVFHCMVIMNFENYYYNSSLHYNFPITLYLCIMNKYVLHVYCTCTCTCLLVWRFLIVKLILFLHYYL